MWNLKFHFLKIMELKIPQQKGQNRDNRKSIKKTLIIDKMTGEYKEKTMFVDNLFSKRGYILDCNKDYIKLFFDKGLPEDCTLTVGFLLQYI